MRYQKSESIRHRTFRHNDIMAIAAFFEMLVRNEDDEIRFTIHLRDGSSISDTSVKLFHTSSFARKDAKSISFNYRDIHCKNTLELRIQEEYLFSEITNSFEISSYDENWYNSVLRQLTDFLSTIPKNHLTRRIFNFPAIIVSYFVFLAINAVFMKFLLDFDFVYGSSSDLPSNVIFIPFTAFLMMVTLIFLVIAALVVWLFPDSEFALGTPRNLTRRKIRKGLLWGIGTIAIPIALSIVI